MNRTVSISAVVSDRVSLALEVTRQLALQEGEFAVSGSVSVYSKDPEPKPEVAPQLEGAPEVSPEPETPAAVNAPASGIAASVATVAIGQTRCVKCGNPESAHGGNSGRDCPTVPGSEFAAS